MYKQIYSITKSRFFLIILQCIVSSVSTLYDPAKGEISTGGIAYHDISFESLSPKIGIVDQDFQHYAFSVSDNVSLQPRVREIDKEKLTDSLKKVNMYETISNLKNGVDSFYSKEFDSDGAEFSGGQLQRLAIARAIYSDASMLILDEPSSALDPINEQKMYDTIFEISKGKTLILVSHRLSCVKDMDRIFVMEKGKIIETGKHAELMALNGKYAEMFRLQGKRYGVEE